MQSGPSGHIGPLSLLGQLSYALEVPSIQRFPLQSTIMEPIHSVENLRSTEILCLLAQGALIIDGSSRRYARVDQKKCPKS